VRNAGCGKEGFMGASVNAESVVAFGCKVGRLS